MKKLAFVLVLILISSCTPQEISQVELNIEENELETSTTTTTVPKTTTTTVPKTTTTTVPKTTTTTVPKTTTTTVPKTTTTTVPNRTKYLETSLNAYKESFNYSDGSGSYKYFRRWWGPNVTISISGNPSPVQRDSFNYVVGDLNRLIEDVKFTFVETNGDIDFYFGNKQTWKAHNSSCDDTNEYRRSLSVKSSSGRIVSAYYCGITQGEYKEYLDTQSESVAEECAIFDIRDTLTFFVTYSLGNASWEKYGEGIFSSRYCDNGTTYTSTDEDIIKIHYDSRVKNLNLIEDVYTKLSEFKVTNTTTTSTTTTLASGSAAPYWNNDPLTVSKKRPNSADIIWGQANDDVGVTKYRIYLDGLMWTEFDNNGSNRQTIFSLSPDTCYVVTVKAGDSDGNWSEDSNSLRFCTPSGGSSGGSSSSAGSSGSYNSSTHAFITLTGMNDNPYLCEIPGTGERVGLAYGRCLPWSGTGSIPDFNSQTIPAWYNGTSYTTYDPYSSSGGGSSGGGSSGGGSSDTTTTTTTTTLQIIR